MIKENPHILRLETDFEKSSLEDLLMSYEPWGHRIDFSNGVSTMDMKRRVPFSENTLQKFNLIADNMPMDRLAGGRMLDIGCNSGYNCVFSASAFQMEPTGIDVTERHMEVAKLLAKIAGIDANFELASAEEYSNPDSFDLICHFGTLYHLPNPFRSLDLTYSNLKLGGYLGLETQVYDHPEDDNICYFMHMQNNDPTNFWALSTNVLVKYLELIGFCDVEVVKRVTPALMEMHMHRVVLVARK